jgi:hypothetical protein
MAIQKGNIPTEIMLDFPTEHDGVRGMAFIESAVESSKADVKWFDFVV